MIFFQDLLLYLAAWLGLHIVLKLVSNKLSDWLRKAINNVVVNYINIVGALWCKGFISLNHIKRHINIHTWKNPYPCAFCGKGFISRSQIKSNMKSHAGKNPYTWALCGKKFISKNHQESQIESITRKNPYNWALCSKRLIFKKTHTETHEKSF